MDPSRFQDLPRLAVMRGTTASPALTVIDGLSLPSILYRLSLSATSSMTRPCPCAGREARTSTHGETTKTTSRAWFRIRSGMGTIPGLDSGQSGAYPLPWSAPAPAYGVRWYPSCAVGTCAEADGSARNWPE